MYQNLTHKQTGFSHKMEKNTLYCNEKHSINNGNTNSFTKLLMKLGRVRKCI